MFLEWKEFTLLSGMKFWAVQIEQPVTLRGQIELYAELIADENNVKSLYYRYKKYLNIAQ